MFVVNHIIDQLKADRESHEKKEREAAGLRRQRRRSQQESPFTTLTELASRFTAGLGGLSGTEEGNDDLDDDDEEEEEEKGHSVRRRKRDFTARNLETHNSVTLMARGSA